MWRVDSASSLTQYQLFSLKTLKNRFFFIINFCITFTFQLDSYHGVLPLACFWTSRQVLPSVIFFWTSHRHRFRPFSPPPPVRVFILIAHRVQHSHCSSIFIDFSCELTLSRFPLPGIHFLSKKISHEFALGETRTRQIDIGRHAGHLPSHRGRRRSYVNIPCKWSLCFRRREWVSDLQQRRLPLWHFLEYKSLLQSRVEIKRALC